MGISDRFFRICQCHDDDDDDDDDDGLKKEKSECFWRGRLENKLAYSCWRLIAGQAVTRHWAGKFRKPIEVTCLAFLVFL